MKSTFALATLASTLVSAITIEAMTNDNNGDKDTFVQIYNVRRVSDAGLETI